MSSFNEAAALNRGNRALDQEKKRAEEELQ